MNYFKREHGVLELFAGSRSFSKVAEKRGIKTYSTDINPFNNIDQVCDVRDFDLKKVPFIPTIVWCSPPCTFFSVASIGKHWNKDHTPKTEQAKLGVQIVEHTWRIVRDCIEKYPDLLFVIENPRGKLRKLDLIPIQYLHTVWYCQYGDKRAKPTDLWTNINQNNIFEDSGWNPKICFNGNKDCHHEPAPRGSATGTQGIKGTYDRSRVPELLCYELLDEIERINPL